MQPVSFRAFGAVGVCVDGAVREVPGRRERAVLCVLLSQLGEVVSVDRLVEEVWGSRAPETVRGSLQVAVSRLRAILEPDRASGAPSQVLVSSGAGYALLAGPEAVDVRRFGLGVQEASSAAARGDHPGALSRCREAEELWTGAPYADAAESDLVRVEVVRLEELRGTLAEVRAAALLETGHPGLAVADLEPLVAAHPFREHAWHLLALALYRCGRQADALDAVRRARVRLVEELGVDPSPELQRLESDLLSQAGRLDGPSPTAFRRPAPRPSPGPAPDPSPTQVSGLIGRERAVAQVRVRLAGLAESRGSVLVVSGEAGIGKTRLATDAAREAEAAGLRVLWGTCHEADVCPAYWPWVPVVRALAGPRPDPEVAALLSPAGGASTAHPEAAALRIYDAVSRLVAAASAEQPTLVVIEDLHWADSASLQLLAFAAEAWATAPVMLLVTVRMPEAAPPGLAGCLAALARASATRVHLGGLGVPEVGRLVAEVTGHPAEPELVEVMAERTDGNPFFVIELVRLLEAESRLDVDGARDVAVPDGVEDVLRLRLARLPEQVHRLLAVASVCGREVEHGLLARVAGLEVDQCLELLDEAGEARVVEEAEAPGVYRFAHALVRETLYAGLSRARRGRIHAACGEALESSVGDDPDQVAEIAHHLVLGAAVRPELVPSAVAHAVDAAQLAEGRGAFDRALTHWEQARSADELARDPAARSPRRRYGVLLGLGRARYRQGDIAGSREALDAAVALGAEMGEVELVAEAATSFRGAGVWHWREFGTSDPAMQQVLSDCLEQLPEGPLQARVLASLAMELMYEWRSEEAIPYSVRSMEVARSVGDAALLADVAALRELVLFGRPGAAEERLRLAAEVLSLDLTREQELHARFGAACASLQRGDAQAADREMTRCVELARRLRHTGADVPIAWWLFYRALAREDAPAVAELFEQALARHRRSSVVSLTELEMSARLRMAGPHAEISEEALAFVRTHANPAVRAFTAHSLAGAGLREVALDLLGDPVPEGAWDYGSLSGDCMRVEVLVEAGALDRVPQALSRIEPWAAEFAIYGSTECVGSVAYFVGRAREALGDLEGARASYAEAVEANARAGIKPWQRRAEQRLSRLSGAPAYQ